jgi:hypothetical protein
MLVTNVTETIHDPPVSGIIYTIPNFVPQAGPFDRPKTKYVRTDVNEMRLLILEAEGLKFTNTLSSVLKSRVDETFDQVQMPAPPAEWVKRGEVVLSTNSVSIGVATLTNIVWDNAIVTNAFLTNITNKSPTIMEDSETGDIWIYRDGKWTKLTKKN